MKYRSAALARMKSFLWKGQSSWHGTHRDEHRDHIHIFSPREGELIDRALETHKYNSELVDRACANLGISVFPEQRNFLIHVTAHRFWSAPRRAGKTTALEILAEMDRLRTEDGRP